MAFYLSKHDNRAKTLWANPSLSLSLANLKHSAKNFLWRIWRIAKSKPNQQNFLSFVFCVGLILAFCVCGVANAEPKSSDDPYKVGIKKPKTGAFVGGEIGFGGAYSYASMNLYTTRDLQGQPTPATSAGYYSNWNDHIAIPLNVFGGYQWYFYDRPWFHFGVRVRGHIGYTNYNTKMSDYNSAYRANVDFALSSHAIQYGVEAQFLWDFLNMGEHTLGWHFTPIGLEGSTFFDKFSITASGDAQGTLEYDTNIHTKFSYVWNTGLHYYFNAKHMVFATYKYRGYSSGYQTAGKGLNSIRYYNYSNNSFMLGYAYKF